MATTDSAASDIPKGRGWAVPAEGRGLHSTLATILGGPPSFSGAPLAQTPEWLPAVEQFGEGFFLQFGHPTRGF
jgi:hypothetical protein